MTTGPDLPAMGFAVAAATLFAVANNVQREAASRVPIKAGGPLRLILGLLRTPRWLFGSALALAALTLHAAALARGGVILVQAILASSLIVALGIEALRDRRAMHATELCGSAVLVAGVLLLLVVGRPGGGRQAGVAQQVSAGAVLALVVGLGMTASRRRNAVRSTAVVMGGCAGMCFAVDAVFLKGVAGAAGEPDLPMVVTNLVGFAVASAAGNLIVQRAYQRAPLRVVLPAVTAADPLAAFVLGRALLHEHLQGGAGANLAVTAGLVAIAAGIVLTMATTRPGQAQRPGSARPVDAGSDHP